MRPCKLTMSYHDHVSLWCLSLGRSISHHLPWRYICTAKKCDKVRQQNNIKSSTWKASGNPKSLPISHIHSTSNRDTFTPFLAFSLPPRTTSNSMGQHVVRNHVCLCWMVCNLSVLPQVLGSTSQKASNFQVCQHGWQKINKKTWSPSTFQTSALEFGTFKPFQAYQLTILEPAEVLPPSTQSLSIFRSLSPHES